MLSKIVKFVKDWQSDIILFVAVLLVTLLAFALGYITAKMEDKQSIKFEQTSYGQQPL
ncbi:MAG: hypothetical protein WC397_00215 [Candidatus Paceibacterota bacterium]|jgi:uncharacterized membrane protein